MRARIITKTVGLPLLALFLFMTLFLSGANDLFVVAQQKAERITNDQTSPGETIAFSAAEVNALMLAGIEEEGMEGINNAKIGLAENAGVWSGIIDFEKLPQLEPYRNNFLLGSILKGTAPVSTTVSLTSSGGQATLDIKQVTIGETTFEGRTLAFLIQQLVLNDYPDVKLGEPFDLEHNVESVKLSPGNLTLRIRK